MYLKDSHVNADICLAAISVIADDCTAAISRAPALFQE